MHFSLSLPIACSPSRPGKTRICKSSLISMGLSIFNRILLLNYVPKPLTADHTLPQPQDPPPPLLTMTFSASSLRRCCSRRWVVRRGVFSFVSTGGDAGVVGTRGLSMGEDCVDSSAILIGRVMKWKTGCSRFQS